MTRTRIVVWTMPTMSIDCREGPVLSHRRDRVTLSFDVAEPESDYPWESLQFVGVTAVEFTPRSACSTDQVAALDRLVEIRGSAWRSRVREVTRTKAALRHYRITFEKWGCYEILALGFLPPPEGPRRLGRANLAARAS